MSDLSLLIDRLSKWLSGLFLTKDNDVTEEDDALGDISWLDINYVEDAIRELPDRLQVQADRLATEFRDCFEKASRLKKDRTRKLRIAELKSEADDAAYEMRRCFRQASEAFNDDRKAEAKELSVLGHHYEAQAKQLNQQVSDLFSEITRTSETGTRKQSECERLNEQVEYLHTFYADIEDELEEAKQDHRCKLVKYDTSSRVVERMYCQGNISWGYDTRGNILGLDIHRGNETVHYDASFAVTGRSYWYGDVAEHFDLNGRLTGRTFRYNDRSEHFDSSGTKTGTTYRFG